MAEKTVFLGGGVVNHTTPQHCNQLKSDWLLSKDYLYYRNKKCCNQFLQSLGIQPYPYVNFIEISLSPARMWVKKKKKFAAHSRRLKNALVLFFF